MVFIPQNVIQKASEQQQQQQHPGVAFYQVFVIAMRKTVTTEGCSGRGQSAETGKMRRGQVWKGGPGLCLFNPRGWGSAPVNSRQMPSSVEQAGAAEIGTRFRI